MEKSVVPKTPADLHSLKKLFADHIGKRAKIEVAAEPRVLCGEVYCVGNSFVSLVDDGNVAVAELAEIKNFSFE